MDVSYASVLERNASSAALAFEFRQLGCGGLELIAVFADGALVSNDIGGQPRMLRDELARFR